MATDETFGQRLKRIREEKGLTQQQLADLTGDGVTRVLIARLETGQNDPTWDTVKVLCKALNMSCDSFVDTVPVKVKTPRVPSKPPADEPENPKRGRGRSKKGEG